MTHTERISTRRVAKSNPRPTTPPKFCALCGVEVLAGDSYGVSYFNPFYFPYFEIIECGTCMDDFIADKVHAWIGDAHEEPTNISLVKKWVEDTQERKNHHRVIEALLVRLTEEQGRESV